MPSDLKKQKVIPNHVPVLSKKAWTYMKECLDTGWVSSVGSFVNRFEDGVAAYVGAKKAVAVINGTSALHLALITAGVKPGDEVLVSNLTFVASANAIRYCGASPVFIDAHPATWQMDPSKVEAFLSTETKLQKGECINKKTGKVIRALLPVHILGGACDMKALMPLAKSHHLRVVEDAAESMGVRLKGKHLGTFGDMGVFSFNGNKIITTGSGGMVVTNNTDFANYARYLSTQARDHAVEAVHNEVGYNYRLSNINAALGVSQLEELEGFLEKKRKINRRYQKDLFDKYDLQSLQFDPLCSPNYWLNTFLLPEETSLEERQTYLKGIRAQGVEARPLWVPMNQLPSFKKFQAFQIEQSDDLYTRAISLPSTPTLTQADLDRCIETAASLLPK